MKKSLLAIAVFISAFVSAQGEGNLNILDSITEPRAWTLKAITGITGTQTSFVNWAAGGRNNLSAIGFFDGSANYLKDRVKWNNDLKFALGGIVYMDSAGKREGLQKTDDRVELQSSFGYEFEKKWFYTALAGIKTQSLNGYKYPNDSVIISTFAAPAYINISLGVEYAPSPVFSAYLSPLAGKITIVNNQFLADQGAFGVMAASTNSAGEVVQPGSRVRYELGAYFRLKFEKEIFRNIQMKSRLELFSNYVENPQNVDVNAENIFLFKVNDWFSASLNWNLIYDDDIEITDRNNNTGPRTQFKSVLGLGISYTLTNVAGPAQ